jgi:hypothetical protein
MINIWIPSNKESETESNIETEPSQMPLEQLIKEYNFILKAYKNYIKALEMEEEKSLMVLKMMKCNSQEEAFENIKSLTNGLSILMKYIKKLGYDLTDEEALEGINSIV